MTQVRVGGGAVVLGGATAVRVLDAASGRVRWRREGMLSAAVLDDSLVYGTAAGAVVARALRDGRVRWKSDGVCAPPPFGGAARVGIIVRNADDFIAGCLGGRIARIDAASGRVLARSGGTSTWYQVDRITPLPACALGVSGWTDGAALMQRMTILDCKRLRPIYPQHGETSIVGAIGNVAILDDACCFGRPDVYRPATIVRVNLATAAVAPPVDLTPEPDRYPANRRPLGQGARTLLDGTELYLTVDTSIYRYGDPRALPPAPPHRIAADLVDVPLLLGPNLMAVHVRAPNGATADEIVRIHDGELEPRWAAPEQGRTIFGYEPGVAPDVLSVLRTDGAGHGTLLVRIADGVELVIPGACRMVASSRQLVVTICTTHTLVGNRYLEYVAAYRWPGAPSARSTGSASRRRAHGVSPLPPRTAPVPSQ